MPSWIDLANPGVGPHHTLIVRSLDLDLLVEQAWQFGGKGDPSANLKDTSVAAEGGAKVTVNFMDRRARGGVTDDLRTGSDALLRRASDH